MGRAARRAPGQAQLLRAALVAEARRRHGPRAGHPVRRPAGRRPAGRPTARSTRRSPASCSSGTRSSRASGRPSTGSSPTTARCSRRSRSSSTGPAGATSWSTSTRCSTSTTPGSAPTWSPGRTSTPGGRSARQRDPDLLTFDPGCWSTRPPARSPSDYPDAVARGRPGAAADLPVRARRGRRRRHGRRPARDAEPGRGRPTFSWQVPGLRRRPRRRADPVAAQAAAGQLRARRRTSRGTFLAAAPPGEEPLLDALERHLRARTGVVVPARRLGLDEGARRTCVRPSGSSTRTARWWRGQGPRRAQGAAAAAFDAGDGRRRRGRPGSAHRPDRLDLRDVEPSFSQTARRPRGPRLPGAGRRGHDGRPAGASAPRTSRRPRTGSAYAGCWC